MAIMNDEFLAHVQSNPINRLMLRDLPKLGLPQCMLTAGSLLQTAWNIRSGNDPEYGIKDYDVFYFDDHDLSWKAEDRVIQRAAEFLGYLADRVEIKNQARVYLWYEERFGKSYPALKGTEGGIDRFLIACTRLGVRVADGSLYAPDHFDDMWQGILRMNPLNAQPDLFAQKCKEYQERWPWLRVEA